MHISPALVVIVVIVGYLIYLFFPIYHSVQISKKLIAAAIPYEQHPTHPNKTILIAGDSTAVGVGAIDNTDSTAGRLGKQFPNADIINIAVSGARLQDAIVQLQSQQGKRYDLILLQVGANDVTHLISRTTATNEIQKTFELATAISAKTIVLTAGDMGISNLFHWPITIALHNGSLMLREVFMTTVTQFPTVSYIDLFKSKKDDPFQHKPEFYAPDNFHLTGAGYGIWYGEIQKHL
ncbi:MAG: GDSL-type esterase/lipase family protein [Candidatus Paceibacterota bacterium]